MRRIQEDARSVLGESQWIVSERAAEVLDPALFKSLFLSRALGDALDAAGLRTAFRLHRCPVIA